MEGSIFDKMKSASSFDAHTSKDFHQVDMAELAYSLFFATGEIGYRNLAINLEEANLKEIEDQVEQDIANGLISRNEDSPELML